MARPTSVKGLLKLSGAAFVDFLLPCCFCDSFLTNIEKAWFDACPLRIIWKTGNAYGCCFSCIRACSKVERRCYREDRINKTELKKDFGVDIQEAPIRCRHCYKALTLYEKNKCLTNSELFVTRKKHLRGLCDLCRLDINY